MNLIGFKRVSFLLSFAALIVGFSGQSVKAESVDSAYGEAIAPVNTESASSAVTNQSSAIALEPDPTPIASQPVTSGAALLADTSEADGTSPRTTMPGTAAPDASPPYRTSPGNTTPETTEPSETTPDGTLNAPSASPPYRTSPGNNMPETTEPSETTPDGTLTAPNSSPPYRTSPGTNTPDINTPSESTPDRTSPRNTTPDTNTPSQSTPDRTSPGTTRPGTTTPRDNDDITPGRATRSGPSYIGISGNMGVGTDDTAVGNGNLAVVSKIGLTRNLSVRPSALIDENPTVMVPITVDFATNDVAEVGLNVAPYLGAGVSLATGDDNAVDLMVTGGVDVPLNDKFTATAGVNVTGFDNTAVGVVLGVGYTFPGF